MVPSDEISFKFNRRDAIVGTGSRVAVASLSFLVLADRHQTHEVFMLYKVLENPKKCSFPKILQINAGDSVNFIAADRDHNSENIIGMIPDRDEKWKVKINKEVKTTLNIQGFYGYQGKPHANMGMIALIVIGGVIG